MVSMQLVLDERVWTIAERDLLPDDGHRYELLDGALIVTPAPNRWHQRVVTRLIGLLLAHCPPELEVLAAPFDIQLAEDTIFQPDVLVTEAITGNQARLMGPPRLAVEVLSRSTAIVDRNLKLPRFERAGCPSFWLLDSEEPSLTVWELDESGRYQQVAHVSGEETWTAALPFPVTLSPAALRETPAS